MAFFYARTKPGYRLRMLKKFHSKPHLIIASASIVCYTAINFAYIWVLLAPMPILDTEHKVKIDVQLTPAHDGQVTVHCVYKAGVNGELIRIWKSTFLRAVASSAQSTLVHAEGITFYPQWLALQPNETHIFTLIFTPLPKDVLIFDLVEDIPQDGGFIVRNIQRNSTDVYRVRLQG